jgi:hypothetical protein
LAVAERLLVPPAGVSVNSNSRAAMEYHKRWEVENTLDELKVHLLGSWAKKSNPLFLNRQSSLDLNRTVLGGVGLAGICD